MTGELKEKLAANFQGLETGGREDDRFAVKVEREAVMSLLSMLRDHGYDHLHMVSCVDRIEKGVFEIVYLLSVYNKDNTFGDGFREVVQARTTVPRDNPSMVSVIPLFPVAEPYEREIHELFGVYFQGHPRLTPLLLERDYEIPPFRKDFDTRAYVEEFFGSVPPVGEEGEGP